MRHPHLFLVFFFLPVFCSAQRDSLRKIGFVLSEVSIQSGLEGQDGDVITLDEIRQLVPESDILQNHIPYNPRGYFDSYGPVVNIFASFRRTNSSNRKSLILFELGIGYEPPIELRFYDYKEESYRKDTVISPITGQPEYVDSVQKTVLNFDYISKQWMLYSGLRIKTACRKRWRFSAGLGLAAGIPGRTQTNVADWKDTMIWTGNMGYGSGGSEDHREFILNRNKSSRISVHIPVSIDFRLGSDNNQILRRSYLFIEATPGYSLLLIPAVHRIAVYNLKLTAGIRFSIDRECYKDLHADTAVRRRHSRVSLGYLISPEYCFRYLKVPEYTNLGKGLRDSSELPRLGHAQGLSATVRLNNMLNLELGIQFSGRGYRTSTVYDTSYWGYKTEEFKRVTYRYFDFPMKLNGLIPNVNYLLPEYRWRFFWSMGLSANIYIHQAERDIVRYESGYLEKNYERRNNNVNYEIARLNMTLVAGAGAQYLNSNGIVFRIEPVYRHSLHSIRYSALREYLYSAGINFAIYCKL